MSDKILDMMKLCNMVNDLLSDENKSHVVHKIIQSWHAGNIDENQVKILLEKLYSINDLEKIHKKPTGWLKELCNHCKYTFAYENCKDCVNYNQWLKEQQMLNEQKSKATHFVSMCCTGVKCGMCGNKATHKVSDVIFNDDPNPIRHELTTYVCCDHFKLIFGMDYD